MPTDYTYYAHETDITFDDCPLVLTYNRQYATLTIYDPESDSDTVVEFDPKLL